MRLHRQMRDVTEPVTGHIRIVMASHVVCPLFDQVLADFRETHPRASLTLDVTGSNVAVEEAVAQRRARDLPGAAASCPADLHAEVLREFFGLYCVPDPSALRTPCCVATPISPAPTGSPPPADQLGDVLLPVALPCTGLGRKTASWTARPTLSRKCLA